MSGTSIPEGWETGHRDGYYTKTLRVNNCKVTIHRPILDDQDRAKREENVRNALKGLIRKDK